MGTRYWIVTGIVLFLPGIAPAEGDEEALARLESEIEEAVGVEEADAAGGTGIETVLDVDRLDAMESGMDVEGIVPEEIFSPWERAAMDGSAGRREVVSEEAGEPASGPEQPDWIAPMVEKIEADAGTWSWEGDPAQEVLDAIAERFGVPIVVDRSVRETVAEATVRMRVDGMTVEQVIRWVVRTQIGLDYALTDGAILVTAEGEARDVREVERVYDFGAAAYRPPDFPGPVIDIVERYDDAPSVGLFGRAYRGSGLFGGGYGGYYGGYERLARGVYYHVEPPSSVWSRVTEEDLAKWLDERTGVEVKEE